MSAPSRERCAPTGSSSRGFSATEPVGRERPPNLDDNVGAHCCGQRLQSTSQEPLNGRKGRYKVSSSNISKQTQTSLSHHTVSRRHASKHGLTSDVTQMQNEVDLVVVHQLVQPVEGRPRVYEAQVAHHRHGHRSIPRTVSFPPG